MCVCACSRQIRSGPDGGKVPGAKRFAGTGPVGEERERRGGCKASGGSERKRRRGVEEDELRRALCACDAWSGDNGR